MSSRLYWYTKPKQKSLDDDIKFKLREYFECGILEEIRIDSSHEDILKAFAISGVNGAHELLNALINNGDIYIKEEW
jgi:hypothetical protein